MAPNKPMAKHGDCAQIVLEQISAGIILEPTILEILGWEADTKIEIQVREDSIALTRRPKVSTTDAAEFQRNSWAPPPAALINPGQ